MLPSESKLKKVTSKKLRNNYFKANITGDYNLFYFFLSLETKEEQQYLTSNYINISIDSLRRGKNYLVWVQAENVLGMEKSKQLQIHLDDIGKE